MWKALTKDLRDELDWYFSHYPEITGNIEYEPIKEFDNLSLSSLYKWKLDKDLNTVTITVIAERLSTRQLMRILDGIDLMLEERISLLTKRNYIIIIEDTDRFPVENIIDNPIYCSNVSTKEFNICNLSLVCIRFNSLIDLCEQKKIALKLFYKVGNINREFFVNSHWIV